MSHETGAERSVPGSVNIPVGKWPDAKAPGADDNADKIASEVVERLNSALSKKDHSEVSSLFAREGYWRDHCASSFDLRTIKTEALEKFLNEHPNVESVAIERGSDFQTPHFGPLDGVSDPQGVTFIASFKSKLGTGKGCVRLANNNGWKIAVLFLSLEELAGHKEPTGPNRTRGVDHGAFEDRRNWQARRTDDRELKDKEPVVLILGAGQAGLMLSARLKMQGVETLIIDKNERVGDNWRKRYDQLVLHDPVWYDHMPYLPFPKHWPVFTPKDKLAEWFEAYAKVMELNVWTSAVLKSSKYDDSNGAWTVEIERSSGTRTLHPRHIIQATGHSGKKFMPDIKGIDSFKGHRLSHSSEHPGARPGSKGRKAIVVGACNSGHDIAHDFYEKGYETTMVQRSSTCIVSSASITDIGLAGLYDENGPATEDADLWLWGLPSELLKSQQAKVAKLQRENDSKTLAGLKKAGFSLDDGPSGGGLFIKYFQRGGGYYIDVGASQLIIDGKIKVKQGQEITEVLENGLKFADGTIIEADEIVFATGYQNMRTQAKIIFGDEVASRIGDYWGFDEEGEFRMQAKRSGHPGFWYLGGNLAINRYYSRLLALQLKAIETGVSPRTI